MRKFILWINGVFGLSSCCECDKLKQEIKRLKWEVIEKDAPSYFLNSLNIASENQYKSCLNDYSRLNRIVYKFIEATESPEWEQGNYSILKTRVKRFIKEVEDL
jgi:hypothetical protein